MEAPSCVCVERKKDLREIYTNCLNPKARTRFVNELARMYANYKRRILFIEATPYDLLKSDKYVEEPSLVVDAFQRLLIEYGVDLHMMPTKTQPQRRAAGEWVARSLINGALKYGRQD